MIWRTAHGHKLANGLNGCQPASQIELRGANGVRKSAFASAVVLRGS